MKEEQGRSMLLAGAAGAMACAAVAFTPHGACQGPAPIVLVDSTGKVAAKPMTDTVVLVTDPAGRVVAPASIRAIQSDDGRAASGLANWQSGGSVLYTSADCTTGAHVYSSSSAGLRAATQVETPAGIVLHIGALGMPATVTVRSILYDNGCTAVTVRQNGLMPVDVTVNLTATYPPPLSFR
jgi:hypothetical protein